jgi:hypothetical protein
MFLLFFLLIPCALWTPPSAAQYLSSPPLSSLQNAPYLFNLIGLYNDSNNILVSVRAAFTSNATIIPSFSIPLPTSPSRGPSYNTADGVYDSYTASYVYRYCVLFLFYFPSYPQSPHSLSHPLLFSSPPDLLF